MTKSNKLLSTAGQTLVRFCKNENGATAIEYAMIASGVGVTIASTVYVLGGSVKNMFTTLAGLFP